MRKRETGKSKAVNPRYTLSDKMISLVILVFLYNSVVGEVYRISSAS